MKIAYVTQRDANDIKTWSGLNYFIGQSLQQAGGELIHIGPLTTLETFALRMKRKFYTRVLRRNFFEEREPIVTRDYARQVTEKVARSGAQVIVCTHTELLADYEPQLPVVYWTDSNFAGMLDFYPYFCNLHPATIRAGHAMERRALDRCALAIYTSDWAAHDALHTYGADPKKVKVIPFGANIQFERTPDNIAKLLAARPRNECRLLFIGRIWERKGGDHAIAVAEELNKAGLKTTLTLAGSSPPDGRALPPFVKCAGFINKGTEEGKRQFDALLGESHFLIVPSRAEAFGLVFCEASSYGVPSLTTNVGGIPTIIRDGLNGRTFPLTATASEWAAHVLGLFKDFPAYEHLAHSAFNEYQTRLNWRVNGRAVMELLKTLV